MLCFLPPVVPPPRQPLPPRPRGRLVATWTASLVATAALFLPIGWIHTQTVYELRVGVASHLGPRSEDRRLLARLGARSGATTCCAYSASNDGYGAVPPGLDVDKATGALVGTPTLPGTYTLALSVSDGKRHALTGSTFQVRVLPAS